MIVGFMHIGQLHCYKEVNAEILNAVRDCGLLNRLDHLYLGVVGEPEFEWPYIDHKISIAYRSPNLREFEYATTKLVEKHCKLNPNDKVLHFHNSGVKNGKRNANQYADEKYPWWRYWEVYHTLFRYEECIKYLDEYDAVGIEIQEDPFPHFSGNWWWANASYVNTLISVEESKKFNPNGGIYDNPDNMHGAEFWIGLTTKQDKKWKSLSQTGYHWIERQKAIENVVKPELIKLRGYWNE